MPYQLKKIFEIIKNRRYVLLFAWMFFCLIGYLENKGYSIVSVIRQDYFMNKYKLFLMVFLTYIFISFGYLLLAFYYKWVFNGFTNKMTIKSNISKCIYIILFYLPLSFIFEWFNYEVSNIFADTLVLINITLLSIVKYLIVFQFSNITISKNPKLKLKKMRDYFFTKSTFVLIITCITITSLFVIIIRKFLDDYFGLHENSNINFLTIFQYYRHNVWISYICIIYQAFISSLFIYKFSNFYNRQK